MNLENVMTGEYWLFWTRESDKAHSSDKLVSLMVMSLVELHLCGHTDMDPQEIY